MTDRREEPATEAGRRLIGSILIALEQEGADVADLSWVDQVAEVEREARSLPAPLDVPTFRARAETWDAKTAGDAQERAYNRGYAQALDDVATELEGAPNE